MSGVLRSALRFALPPLVLLTGCATTSVDCSEQAQFDRGLNDRVLPAACATGEPAEAWNLGAMIRERRLEIETLRARLDGELSRRESLRARQQLMRAERDLPELEALARLEGWLPPAELRPRR